ncbi:lysostaphin resistance A-like protein [Brevundimonas sp. R86498]|uniref:lysostaphin resistance A-like protein n=1 Tax=Brevundimonas sp. R86498 TaxID=3093845 RepID=UPI0037C7610B
MARRKASVRDWLGLKGASIGLVLSATAAGAGAAFFLLQTPGLASLASGPGTVIHAVTGGSPPDANLLVALALAALFKTALAEELLFRGLIAKRLYGLLGFHGGNLGQAVLFAAIHLPILLLPQGRGVIGGAVIGFALVVALVSGWLNERLGRGSILPGYGLHAGANLTTYWMLAFV